MMDKQRERNSPKTIHYALVLLVFYAFAYIAPLGVRDLFVPDETRYAEIAREMIASGDWIVPHLNGVRYFEKPVLGYWVNAGSILLFGENNFAVRFPSALAVGLSALIIFLLVRKAQWREHKNTEFFAPFAAALVFLSCLEVSAIGNTAVLDSVFTFLLTACIAFFYLATESEPRTTKEKLFLLTSGLFCGFAFLTKGFLAFAVPIMTLAPYLVWQRRYVDLFRMSFIPIVFAIIVAMPWSILIHLRESDYWNYFFWNEHIRRFVASNAQHQESAWYFFLILPGLVFPWTFMIPAVGVGLKKLGNEQPQVLNLLKLCWCWLVIPLLFFSLSKGKLVTYILPCFPPFAIITAIGLLSLAKYKKISWTLQNGIIANGALLALALSGFTIIQLMGFHGLKLYQQPWKVIMIISSFLFSIICYYFSFRDHKEMNKITLAGISLLLIYFSSHYSLPDLTIEKKCPAKIFQNLNNQITNNDLIITDEETAAAACWYLKRNDIYIAGNPGEFQYGLDHENNNSRLLTTPDAIDLINRNKGKSILITRMKSYNQYNDKLPTGIFKKISGEKGYILAKY